jgi:hypothetical protein
MARRPVRLVQRRAEGERVLWAALSRFGAAWRGDAPALCLCGWVPRVWPRFIIASGPFRCVKLLCVQVSGDGQSALGSAGGVRWINGRMVLAAIFYFLFHFLPRLARFRTSPPWLDVGLAAEWILCHLFSPRVLTMPTWFAICLAFFLRCAHVGSGMVDSNNVLRSRNMKL